MFLTLGLTFLRARYTYYYSASALGWEITIMVLMLTLEATRFQLASRGNKTEKFLPLAWSAGLAIPSLVGYCFFVDLQTYMYVCMCEP